MVVPASKIIEILFRSKNIYGVRAMNWWDVRTGVTLFGLQALYGDQWLGVAYDHRMFTFQNKKIQIETISQINKRIGEREIGRG